MKLNLVVCGKIKEKWLSEGIAEYKKRLGRYCEVVIVEVADVSDQLPLDVVLQKEGQRLLAKVKEGAYVLLLDLQGKTYTSSAWSQALIRAFDQGGAELTCIIGGSNGLDPEVIRRADLRVCLSPMTFTHQMTRLIFLEQCYRAFRIDRGEPYHK